jgi:hypothetical protein
MIEDFKNVIITFGVIGIVFMQGSYSYQNKILSDSVTATKQANIQKIKNDVIATKNKNLLLLQAKQQQDLLNQQITQAQIVIPKTPANTPGTTSAQADAILAQQQTQAALLAKQKAAALLAQQQAQALAQAQANALAQAQAASVTPSRQSRAS